MTTNNHALWITVCNPENRRFDYFLQALSHYQHHQVTTISYTDLLCNPSETIKKITAFIKQCKASQLIVRFDSPGENFEVEKGFIAAGSLIDNSRINYSMAKHLTFNKGQIRYSKEWYLGFKHFLLELRALFGNISQRFHKQLHFMNAPQDIAQVFDKAECQATLAAAHIPTATLIPDIHHYDELLTRLHQKKLYRVFIKLKHGSSASGVVAFQLNPRTQEVLIDTSVERINKNNVSTFYNSLHVRRYKDVESIKEIINFLFEEGAYVESWVPKPQIQSKSYDLRVLVINQQATHYVIRKSHSPMTNLHLGNERGHLREIADGETRLSHAKTQAMKAAALFPNLHSVGIDVIAQPEEHKTKIIELNAFGDLLPGIRYQNADSYEWQIRSFIDNHLPYQQGVSSC